MIEFVKRAYTECSPDWRDKIPQYPGLIALGRNLDTYMATRCGGFIYAAKAGFMHDAKTELVRWINLVKDAHEDQAPQE